MQTQQVQPPRAYKAKDFSRLVGTRGFSEAMLTTHFELYESYVTHTNEALDLLRGGTLDDLAAGEVRRRLVWEFNGMRLHELYFGNMAPDGRDPAANAPLQQALAAEHGSIGSWWTRFAKVGATRGSGWAVLCHDPAADRLLHVWVNEHDKGLLATCTPLLVLDLFEHAYLRDYGTERGPYLEAFRTAIDWTACEERFRQSRAAGRGTAGAAA